MPRELTDRGLAKIERSLGVALPALYRDLLREVGYGAVGPDAEIYDPRSVADLYLDFFDDPRQLFEKYFPFGCQSREQELWIIDPARERAAAIWHEYVPDDWADERWLPYARWVARHLTPELEKARASRRRSATGPRTPRSARRRSRTRAGRRAPAP